MLLPFDGSRCDAVVTCFRILLNRRLASIEIWDFVKGEREAKLKGWEESCTQLDVSHDGRLLSFATVPRNFGVFDLEKRRLLFVSPDLSNDIWQMRWNQDATRLGMIEGNGRARILNISAIRSTLGELGLDW